MIMKLSIGTILILMLERHSGKTHMPIYENEKNLIDVFFQYFFPCIEGYGKLIDEHHSSKKLNILQHMQK